MTGCFKMFSALIGLSTTFCFIRQASLLIYQWQSLLDPKERSELTD